MNLWLHLGGGSKKFKKDWFMCNLHSLLVLCESKNSAEFNLLSKNISNKTFKPIPDKKIKGFLSFLKNRRMRKRPIIISLVIHAQLAYSFFRLFYSEPINLNKLTKTLQKWAHDFLLLTNPWNAQKFISRLTMRESRWKTVEFRYLNIMCVNMKFYAPRICTANNLICDSS